MVRGLTPLQRLAGRILLDLVVVMVVLVVGCVAGGLGSGFALRAALVPPLGLVLVAPLVPGLLPATSWGPANRVTLLRSGVVGLVAGFTVDPQSGWWTVALALLAFALDGLDGQVARRWKAGSALGARYDGEIDAIFILVLSALSWQLGRAGAWVLLGGLLRYAFLGAGLLLPWMRRPVPPSYRAKIICVVHVSCLIASLLPPVPPVLAALLAGGGLLALTGSFAVDTAWLWRRRAGDELAPARQEAR